MKRLLVIVGCLFLALVLVLGIAYLGRAVPRLKQRDQRRHQVVSETRARLPAARTAGRAEQRAAIRAARAMGAPAYSWEELDCSFSSRDAGLIVQSWKQECLVRTVALYEVPTAPDGDCAPEQVPAGADPTAYEVVRGRGRALTSTTDDFTCPANLLARAEPSATSRLLSGRKPRALAPEDAYLVVATRTAVIDADLGCGPWDVLSCSRPWDRPVYPP